MNRRDKVGYDIQKVFSIVVYIYTQYMTLPAILSMLARLPATLPRLLRSFAFQPMLYHFCLLSSTSSLAFPFLVDELALAPRVATIETG